MFLKVSWFVSDIRKTITSCDVGHITLRCCVVYMLAADVLPLVLLSLESGRCHVPVCFDDITLMLPSWSRSLIDIYIGFSSQRD